MEAPPGAAGTLAPGGAAVGAAAAPVPSDAPALLWLVVFGAVALWWLWPWLARLRGDPAEPTFGAPSKARTGMRLPHAPLAAEVEEESPLYAGGSPDDPDCIAEAGTGRLECALDFDLMGEFKAAFVAASEHLGRALDMPPAGAAYTASIMAIKKVAEILDLIFQACGSPEKLAKVSRLREGSEAFRRDFGEHRHGEAMRGLLKTAGFERLEGEPSGSCWVLPTDDALARLRAMTVRLCLLKSAELQKLRGAGRFMHRDNEAVVPKLENALFVDLIDLYRGRAAPGDKAPSLRERNLEAGIRVKLNGRRAERGLEPLALHEGMAAICRSLAEAQRTRARLDSDDLYPRRRVASEVRAALARLPLPPGFTVAHLHWSSTELPKLFGMANTRGGAAGTGTDRGADLEDSDQAANIMANEAVGFWAARQMADVYWPAGSICGIGTALDYTVNKGFAVALVIGFEAQDFSAAGGCEELQEGLRRRVVERPAEGPKAPEVKFTPAKKLGTRITGFRDLGARKPPGGG